MTDWLRWALLPAAGIHIFEEFVFPGGFPAWYRTYRADPSRITTRFLVIVNVALVIVCLNVGLVGRDPTGVPFWLVISALLCANGCWHGWASYKTRGYSPGVITGLLIYLPLAVYGYLKIVGSGAVSVWIALVAFAVGASYQVWDAAYLNRGTRKT
jgi:hypothetical protein